MHKILRTESDIQEAFQRIKQAADHHATTVNQVIDHLFEAIKQFKDANSTILYDSNGVEFTISGTVYRLQYANGRIDLNSSGQLTLNNISFDNTNDRASVMSVFQGL